MENAFRVSIPILWGTFGVTVICLLSILFVAKRHDLELLDLCFLKYADVRDKVENLLLDENHKKRNAHIFITSTLDVAFPLSYGFLLAALAVRFFPNHGINIAIPALLAMLFDLAEGIIQLLILTKKSDNIQLKLVITRIKFVFFIIALIIALIGI